jgi:DnaJ-class molecular chaperone
LTLVEASLKAYAGQACHLVTIHAPTYLTHAQRNGNDLEFTAPLSLADALCGTTLRIPHLDGSTIELPVTDVVTPSSLKIVK